MINMINVDICFIKSRTESYTVLYSCIFVRTSLVDKHGVLENRHGGQSNIQTDGAHSWKLPNLQILAHQNFILHAWLGDRCGCSYEWTIPVKFQSFSLPPCFMYSRSSNMWSSCARLVLGAYFMPRDITNLWRLNFSHRQRQIKLLVICSITGWWF